MSFRRPMSRRGGCSRGGRFCIVDFEKIKEAVKFQEVTEPKSVEAIIIDDIEVGLTPTDHQNMAKLGEGGKKLYIVLRKCHKSKRYDFVPIGMVCRLLKATEKEVPVLKPDTQSAVVCSSADNPHKFCLQWIAQEQRLYFLNCWMEDMINRKKLVQFNVTQEDVTSHGHVSSSFVGRMVVAHKRSNEMWVRGQITKVISNETATVYFTDYGDDEIFDLDELYHQPSEIAKIPSMCFAATFTNVHLPENCKKFDWETRDLFVTSMANVGEVECYIVAVDENSSSAQDKIYSVRLCKLAQEDGVDHLDLGDAIQQSILQRGIPRVLSNDFGQLQPTVEEIDNLIFDSQVVDIHPYKEAKFHGLRVYRFLNIISPAEFYLEYVSDSLDDKRKDWMTNLQRLYGDKKRAEVYKIKTSRVFKRRCYVWQNPEDSKWHRVRVCEPNVAEGKAQVWLLDGGILQVVDIKNMMELDPNFAAWNAVAFKAHLVDVKPAKDSQKWSEAATAFLKETCISKKRFLGIPMSVVTGNDYADTPTEGPSFGMMLAEKFTGPKFTVQAQLVQRHWADGCGLSAGPHNLAFCLTGTPIFDRFALYKHFSWTKHLEKSIVGPPKVKTTAQVAREQQMYLKGNLLNGTEHSLQQVIGSDALLNSFYREPVEEPKLLPSEMQKNLACIKISSGSTVLGPCRFYIQMLSKATELEQMMEDLENILKDNTKVFPDDKIIPGLIAALQVLDDKAIPFWSRVIVKTYIRSIKLVKVLLIDYGLETAAKITTLRALPSFFERIPPFCHRAHFDFFSSSQAKVLMPISGQGWSPLTNRQFKNAVDKWNKHDQHFYAWQENSKRNVRLEEFNQRLLYDQYTESWYPDVFQNKTDYAAINAKKDHHLVAHFFTSMGIDMVYETTTESDNKFYEFVPVWKCLTIPEHGLIV